MAFEIDWSEEGSFIIAGILFILAGIVGIFPMIYEYVFSTGFTSLQSMFMNLTSAFIGVMLLIVGIDTVA